MQIDSIWGGNQKLIISLMLPGASHVDKSVEEINLTTSYVHASV